MGTLSKEINRVLRVVSRQGRHPARRTSLHMRLAHPLFNPFPPPLSAFHRCRSIDKQLSGSPAAAMLQASMLSREGKAKEADAVLAVLAAGDAAQAAEAALMRAQLAAASGDAAGALRHLEVGLWYKPYERQAFMGLLLDRRLWCSAGGAEVLAVGGEGGTASRRHCDAECKQHEVAH